MIPYHQNKHPHHRFLFGSSLYQLCVCLVPEGTVAEALKGIQTSAGEFTSSESENAPEIKEYPSPKNLINKNAWLPPVILSSL